MRKKQLRIAGFPTLPNARKGWREGPSDPQSLFATPQPLVLELGCGKGYFLLALAQLQPERNYLGVDVKADRLWMGASQALTLGLTQVRFVQEDVFVLAARLPAASVQEIWLTFPDPYPLESQAVKRLTHGQFQTLYRRILAPGGSIHLKTDDPALLAFTQDVLVWERAQVLHSCRDVHSTQDLPTAVYLQSHFEGKWRQAGRPISWLHYTF